MTLIGAVFGDGTRGEIIALAADLPVRRWLTDPVALSRWIDQRVGWCLPAADRVADPGETEADAGRRRGLPGAQVDGPVTNR